MIGDLAMRLTAVDIAPDDQFMVVKLPDTWPLWLVLVGLVMTMVVVWTMMDGVSAVVAAIAYLIIVPGSILSIVGDRIDDSLEEFRSAYGVEFPARKANGIYFWTSEDNKLKEGQGDHVFSMRFFTDSEDVKRSYYTMKIEDGSYIPVMWSKEKKDWVPGPYPETVAKKLKSVPNQPSTKEEATAPESGTEEASGSENKTEEVAAPENDNKQPTQTEEGSRKITSAEMEEFLQKASGSQAINKKIDDMQSQMDRMNSKMDAILEELAK